nr:MAG TPA: LRRC37A/B like protein 1 C-terminal domain [Caudoviricetes sp.]
MVAVMAQQDAKLYLIPDEKVRRIISRHYH